MIKISIITITHNSERTILQTLQSVHQQTYPNLEHIIIDGSSTDSTLQIIEQYKDSIAYCISEPDKGIYDALNKGIAAATGDVIGILNSDDMFASREAVAHIAQAFEQNDIEVLYGDLEYCKIIPNTPKQIIRQWKSNPFRKKDLRYGWMPPHPTLYCRKEIFAQNGTYNDTYTIAGDYDFMLRLFQLPSLKSFYLPEVLVTMRTGGISNRNLKNIIRKMQEDWRAIRANHLPCYLTLFCKNIRKVTQFFH